MNRDAAELDLDSAWQAARARAMRRGSGAVEALEEQQNAWRSGVAASCAAAPSTNPDCRTRAAHARAAALQAAPEAAPAPPP